MTMPEHIPMRDVYCNTLRRLARQDERIVVLEADMMKSSGTAPFQAEFPDRFLNVGIAEANMIGVAAGLAACNKIPVAHSFGCFLSRRCLDQIAISVAYTSLNVKLCGTTPGITAELNGGTHMSMEDVGIMRSLATMVICEPADTIQLEQALPQLLAHRGPAYLRLFRGVAERITGPDYVFELGKADTILPGDDVTLFATGIMVKPSLDAAAILQRDGISAQVVNVHTVKPIDAEGVARAAGETGAAVTAENHNIIGGLGSAVAEVLAERMPVPMLRVGVRDRFGEVGRREELAGKLGLTAQDIAAAATAVIARKRACRRRDSSAGGGANVAELSSGRA